MSQVKAEGRAQLSCAHMARVISLEDQRSVDRLIVHDRLITT